MRQWRVFFSRRIRLRFCYLVQNGLDMSLWLRYTIECWRIVTGATGSICKYVDCFFFVFFCFFLFFFVFFTCLNILKSILKKKVDYYYFHIYRVRSTAFQRASCKLRQKKCLKKKKKNSNMLDKTSCFSLCYQILLRPLIDCKIIVLWGLSTDFFEQVILNPLLWPNSNKQEGSCSK